MQNKKILYFDYWTVGIKNFKFFDQILKDKGFETKLVHLNSWKGIEGPEVQQIQGIDCYDITYYKTDFLFDVLSKEMPAVVVMLNASFITDRTIILICKTLGIKSIYLAHGSLTREEFIDSSISSLNKAIKKTRIKRAISHLRTTAVNYLHSLFRYDKKYMLKLHPYKVLVNTFLNPAKYLLFPPHAFDLEPDLIMVYGNAERDFFRKRLSPEKSSIIKVTGMPDLDRYFQEADSLPNNREQFLSSYNIPLDKPYVTYIEEGIVQDKVWREEEGAAFFEAIAEMCMQAGLHLVIKLHPRTAKSSFRSAFERLKGVTVLDDANFPKLVYFTDKCISHYSTTFIYPILLNKPILVPRWGKSAELLEWFSEKEVTYVHSVEEFKQFLKRHDFQYNRSEYLEKFVPFTDGNTAQRIADYILEKIQ